MQHLDTQAPVLSLDALDTFDLAWVCGYLDELIAEELEEERRYGLWEARQERGYDPFIQRRDDIDVNDDSYYRV